MSARRMLVAVDFRPPSLRAVRWAREFAGPATRVDVAWVLARGDEADERRAMEALEGFATTFGPTLPGLHVRVGDPQREIVRLLDELDIDLLVVGRNLAGGNDGQTSARLLRDARLPVLVVGAGGAPRPRRILVGLDDPAGSRRVLCSALALARRFSAELAIVTVLQPALKGSHHAGASRRPAEDVDLVRARAGLLDAVARAAAPAGIRVRAEVCRGDPATKLLALAEAGAFDLIVIGQSRNSAATAPGSVARHLARTAPMSVLVVPPEGEWRSLLHLARGSRIETVVPSPAGLSISRRPACPATMPRAMASPSPVPSFLVE